MNKSRKILILGIGAVIVVSAVIFLFENKNEEELRKLSITGELIARFESMDSKSYIQTERSSFRWNDEDGYSILVPATEHFFIVDTKAGCPELVNPEKTPPHIYKKELTTAEKVFTERGFVLNKNNSSTSTSDRHFYDYVQAYTKENDLCTVVVNADCVGKKMAHTLSVSCGNTFAEAQAEQLPFLKALELKDTNTIVRVRKQSGAFFQLGVGWLRGGMSAVLKKEGETYRVILMRQEAPYCSLIEKEQIPYEVLSSIGGGSCFTDDGGYIRIE